MSEVTKRVIGAAIEVHRSLGPGLLESAYEQCLCREFDLREIPYRRQVLLPVEYKGIRVDASYRVDLVVNDVVVEIKSVIAIDPVHEAQILTYMKLGCWPTGLLINFNVPMLVLGIRRFVL